MILLDEAHSVVLGGRFIIVRLKPCSLTPVIRLPPRSLLQSSHPASIALALQFSQGLVLTLEQHWQKMTVLTFLTHESCQRWHQSVSRPRHGTLSPVWLRCRFPTSAGHQGYRLRLRISTCKPGCPRNRHEGLVVAVPPHNTLAIRQSWRNECISRQ